MFAGRPRLTIVLPVYNGEQYLAEALGDLLAQEFCDFELIVSDNASTDRSPQIIAEAAAADRRVRVQRHRENIGAARNFHSLFRFARTPYFMFAAHDDRWEPSYVRRMIDALDKRPEAVLACADSAVIDEFSDKTGKVYPSLDTAGRDVVGRVRGLIEQFAWVESYGVMRSEALRAIGAFKSLVGGDVIFLMEMLLLGEITTIHEPLFLYRMPSGKVTDHAYYASWWPTTRQDPQTYTALVRYLFRAACSANLPAGTLADIRRAFIETIGVPHGEWFAAIAGERGFHPQSVSTPAAQAIIMSLLDEAVEGVRR
jgi:glycosyltransferase involved in cell wall biosynthesis